MLRQKGFVPIRIVAIPLTLFKGLQLRDQRDLMRKEPLKKSVLISLCLVRMKKNASSQFIFLEHV